jgi:hypothetical protein
VNPLSHTVRLATSIGVMLLTFVCLALEARSQERVPTPLPAPPPFRFVPRDLRSQLAGARDTKARMRLSVELAEARLARAEQLTGAQQFDFASSELGLYQGLIDDALRYLRESKIDKNKLRDIYKRFELTLRAHGSRIEAMRRVTPLEYAVNFKAIGDATKDARTEALNGFYGGEMLESTTKDGTPPETERPKESPQPPPREQP